jgi:hypothetical protein
VTVNRFLLSAFLRLALSKNKTEFLRLVFSVNGLRLILIGMVLNYLGIPAKVLFDNSNNLKQENKEENLESKPKSNPNSLDFMVAELAEELAPEININFIRAIIQNESGWNPKAVSHKGAVGLMQLMPETAKQYGCFDRTDPNQNLSAGIRFLNDLYQEWNGDYRWIAAAYNAGPTAARRFHKAGQIEYNETEIYANRVVGYMMGRDSAEGIARPICKSAGCLHLKSLEAVAGGSAHKGTEALAGYIQNNMLGFAYISSLNDAWHQRNSSTNNKHRLGLAIDLYSVQFADGRGVQTEKALQNLLKDIAPKAIVRYYDRNNCKPCTAPHIHIEWSNDADAQEFADLAIENGWWESSVLYAGRN